MKLHFIDSETSGLTEQDEPIEIAIMTWDDGVRDMRYSKAFWPLGPVHDGAARVNGFTPGDWAARNPAPATWSHEHAKGIAACLADIEFWCGSNPSFDERVLKAAFERVRVPWISKFYRRIDLASLAFPLFALGKIQKTGLEAVASYYGVGPVPHTAPGDCMIGADVFEKLCFDSLEGFDRT